MVHPLRQKTFNLAYRCHTESCSHVPIKTWGHPILSTPICNSADFPLTGRHNKTITYHLPHPNNEDKEIAKTLLLTETPGENSGQG